MLFIIIIIIIFTVTPRIIGTLIFNIIEYSIIFFSIFNVY